MKILVAPSGFKGHFSAREACEAICEGIREARPKDRTRCMCLADGGEGTLDAILSARAGRPVPCYVHGPRSSQIRAEFGMLDDTGEAFIETARAAGLSLVPPHARDPEMTTTLGVGELVLEALERGCRKITLTLGDSATVDGGLGMAGALGFRFLDAKDLEVGHTGGVMRQLARLDRSGAHGLLAETTFEALFDVRSPLLGPDGAAAVFGPQKGADAPALDRLEEGLENMAALAEKDLGIDRDLRNLPGAGAAGGLGWGCGAWLGAELLPGASRVLELLEFDKALQDSDLLITAEGSYDAQSGLGKATDEAVSRAREAKVRALVLCASGEGDDVWSAASLGEDRAGTQLGLKDLAELARRAVASVE